MPLLSPGSAQRGSALIVSLIMMTLITVMVTSAFMISSANLRSVGNMQIRDEAIAAGNKAIEQVLSSPFTNSPAPETVYVDINNDGAQDYKVVFNKPTCISDTKLAGVTAAPSSLSLGSAFNTATDSYYETVWDLDAAVSDAVSGTTDAAVHVRQGVRVLLTQTQYDAVCT